MLILDTGVLQRLLGLNIGELMISDRYEVVNMVALTELDKCKTIITFDELSKLLKILIRQEIK